MTLEERAEAAEKFLAERTGWHGLGAEMLREVFADLYGEKPTARIVPIDRRSAIMAALKPATARSGSFGTLKRTEAA